MTVSVSGIRCRAYPDLTLQELLPQWIGSQRVIYNAKVNEDRYYKSVYRKALSLTGEPTPLDQQYSRYVEVASILGENSAGPGQIINVHTFLL